jgi:hypothetical protein
MNGNIMHGHWQAEAISASSQAHTYILMDGPEDCGLTYLSFLQCCHMP